MFLSRRTFTAIAAMLLIVGPGLHQKAEAVEAAPPWLGGPLIKPLADTRIGVTVLYPGSNSYQAKYAEEAARYAHELGIQAIILDPQGDPAKQFSQVQDLISQHVDAIVLWPTSEKALIPAVRAAKAAGIPVVTTNSEIGEEGRKYIVAHTGPSDCILAQQAADELGTALNGKGDIVVVEGTPGYTVSRVRKNCFMEVMSSKFPGVKILDSQPANWNREKAQTVTEDFLTKYGNKINGIYAFDDGMGSGVINALKAANYKPGEIKVVTCNLFREGYDSIKEGWETGSSQQSPIEDARLAIRTAIQIVNGIKVPEKQTIPHEEITAGTISQFSPPTW